MKFEKYERPELEEIEIELEGSFLNGSTSVEINPEPENPDDGEWD